MAVRTDDITSLDFGKEGGGATGVHVLGHLSGLLANMIEVHHIWREDSATIPARLTLQFSDHLPMSLS
ncbi:MAG: hypothetical protein ACRDHH_01850, partial [Actinomycetota bacterium]